MIDCAGEYPRAGSTVMVPAFPSVNVDVETVLYLSPEDPLVPLVPLLPDVPGLYPRIATMSAAVIGEADVTNPFAFTENLRGVCDV